MRYLPAILFLPLALQASSTRDLQKLAKLPVRFESDGAKSYVGRGFGYRVAVTPSGHTITIAGESGERTVRVGIAGANLAAPGHGESPLVMKTSYFRGKPENWRQSITSYAKVQFDQVLPGVDVVYHGTGDQFEFDYVVRPGADPRNIVLRYQGQDGLSINENGDLNVRVGKDHIVQQLPVIYQKAGDSLRLISGHYAVKGRDTVAFELGAYDRTQALVIDPVVVYSANIGGQGTDTAVAVQRGADGYLYVAGNARSIDLATTSDAFYTTIKGDQDVFLMKVDTSLAWPDGILSLTYIGGSSTDTVKGMTVNAAGIVYLTGSTSSTDFPIAVGATQDTQAGGQDIFVVKFAPVEGTGAVLFSTFYGGTGDEQGNAITVDSSGTMYITGQVGSYDFPVTADAIQGASGGNLDTFLLILDDSGYLDYATFLGGAGDDIAQAIAIRSDNAIVISGTTKSQNFPTAGGSFDTGFHGGGDGFVAVLVPYVGLDGLIYGTYIGGSGLDDLRQMAFNSAGQLIVAGHTTSTDFPVTTGAYQAYNKNSADIFISVLDFNKSQGAALVYSTYLGGSGADVLYGMKLTASGDLLVTGYTYSTDFPITSTAAQSTPGGSQDSFALRLRLTNGTLSVLYGSYLGGPQIDNGYDIEEDVAGNIFVVGNTNSRQFPAGLDTSNAYPGDFNAFLVGVQPCSVTLSQKGADVGPEGGTQTFLVTAASDCSWSVRSAANWIGVSGDNSGIGNGSVTYSVAPNSTTPRQGDLRVFDQKHVVTQAGK